jgi:hypothetical protein
MPEPAITFLIGGVGMAFCLNPCVAQTHLACGAGRTLKARPMPDASGKTLCPKDFLALISNSLLLCQGV